MFYLQKTTNASLRAITTGLNISYGFVEYVMLMFTGSTSDVVYQALKARGHMSPGSRTNY